MALKNSVLNKSNKGKTQRRLRSRNLCFVTQIRFYRTKERQGSISIARILAFESRKQLSDSRKVEKVEMVHCFAPDCDHHSESHTCKFFGFPNKEKKKDEYRRWIRLLRFVFFLYYHLSVTMRLFLNPVVL